MDRRRFLTVLGATGGAAAAASACNIHPEPTEHLVPYVVPPEEQVPGTATYYATTCRECAAGCGLHAKVRDGRVIKLEGNPEAPINEGRLCSRGQAALQGLYNPDRVTEPMARGPNGERQTLSWDDAVGRLAGQVKEARGRGLVFLTGLETGPFGHRAHTWVRERGGRHGTQGALASEAPRAGRRADGAPPRGRAVAAAWLAAPRADAARLERLLPTPQHVAQSVGIAATEIERLAREFAASQGGLAVGGGVATQYGDGAALLVAAVNILHYVAGQGGKTVLGRRNAPIEDAGP